ncbi:MAG TPA: RDD family protein [Acidothermales bacterium]
MLLVLMIVVVLRFVPPSLGNIIGSFFLVWFLLEVPLTAWSGLTVGKHLLGLRVVRLDNGSQRVGLPRATARWLLRIVNGTIGAWAERFTKGTRWAVSPRR